LIAAIVSDPSVDAPKTLAARYAQLFDQTLDRWRSGRLGADPQAADRVAILDWLIAHGRFDTDGGSKLASLLADEARRDAAIPAAARVVAMCDGSAENEHVLIRGNPRKPGEEVPRRFLEVFGGRPVAPSEPGSGRLALAREITGSAAPLAARVIVNRLFQHHFGRGLVWPPDDFGHMGQPPSHPELLDHLAAELLRGGWSLKRLQRMLVLSSTYRMSSRCDDRRADAIDPDSRLLHRMPVRRLEAEAIRDAILAVSGRLDGRLEGPSVPVHLNEFMTGRGRPGESGPLDGAGRRSIYLAVRRNFLTPMFLAFDYPTPFTTAGRRSTSNVPAQALALLNNPFVAQQSQLWAERALAAGLVAAAPAGHGAGAAPRPESTRASTPPGASADDRSHTDPLIAWLYEGAFGRLPRGDELENVRRFLESARDAAPGDPSRAVAELCHVLFNVKEFIYID
jgi:hypothetical protein